MRLPPRLCVEGRSIEDEADEANLGRDGLVERLALVQRALGDRGEALVPREVLQGGGLADKEVWFQRGEVPATLEGGVVCSAWCEPSVVWLRGVSRQWCGPRGVCCVVCAAWCVLSGVCCVMWAAWCVLRGVGCVVTVMW